VYLFFAPTIVCLVAVLVHSIVNEESVTGLNNLVTFQWDCLLDIKVWQMSFNSNYRRDKLNIRLNVNFTEKEVIQN